MGWLAINIALLYYIQGDEVERIGRVFEGMTEKGGNDGEE